jgi:hypothetical protein
MKKVSATVFPLLEAVSPMDSEPGGFSALIFCLKRTQIIYSMCRGQDQGEAKFEKFPYGFPPF